jgi:methylmalonyl-CoA/ethylmalonyl-CoA epimerase
MSLPLVEFSCHHIGYACKDLKKETENFARLGFIAECEIFQDEQQKIRGVFLLNNGHRIELLEPLDESSPVGNFLQKGTFMYHQGFLVPNMELALTELRSQGAILFRPPVPAVAFKGKNIAFLMLKNRLMIELIEGDGDLLNPLERKTL